MWVGSNTNDSQLTEYLTEQRMLDRRIHPVARRCNRVTVAAPPAGASSCVIICLVHGPFPVRCIPVDRLPSPFRRTSGRS